jgi:hypothetical protein
MKESTYKRVSAPVFLAFYFKDENNQDEVVKVDAMITMFDQLGTIAEMKVKTAFPNAGNHVIAGEIFSGAIDELRMATFSFADKVLNIDYANKK